MALSTFFATSLLPSTTSPHSLPKTSSSRSLSLRSSVVVATTSASPPCITESASVSDISSWMAIAFPAVAHSTRLHFKSTTFNVEVKAKEDEPVDKLINRFRKEVMKAGVLQDCKRRRFFENKHDKKKRKARDAARRNRKRFLRHLAFTL